MMKSGDRPAFSRDDVSGLFSALDDAEPAVSVAALRALMRLQLEPQVTSELRPYCAAVEQYVYTWSTWLPDTVERARIDALLSMAPETQRGLARTIAADARSPIIQRFALLALDDSSPQLHTVLTGAEQLSAEVERLGADAVPEVGEIFDAYKVFLPRASAFWFSWVDSQRGEYDPAHGLPSWFPLEQGSLAATRQLEWIASRAGLDRLVLGLRDPLQRGSAGERFAASHLIEWARRAEAKTSFPRFGGGAGPADVLPRINAEAVYKKFSARDLPVAQFRPPLPQTETAAASGAEGERRINVWISDPADPGYRPELGTDCVVSFRVGAPVEASLATGAETKVDDAEIPEAGLATRWTIAPHHASLGSIEATSTIAPSGFAVFDLQIPRRGESPTLSLRVTATNADASLTILIEVGDKRWRELEVPLDGSGKATRDIAAAPLADARLATSHEWTTPPGEVGLNVIFPATALVTGKVNDQRVNGGGTVDIVTDKALLNGPVDDVRKAVDDFRKATQWTAYLNDIDEGTLRQKLTAFKPQYEWSEFDDLADDAHRETWNAASTSAELHDLAFYGRRLYDTLFPLGKPGRAMLDSLLPGHRINIAWLPNSMAGWVRVPWDLLYVGDVSPGVPVEASSFWGLRHRIEYTSYEPTGAASSRLGAPSEASCTSLLFFGNSAKEPATAEAAWQRTMWQSLGGVAKPVVVPQSTGAAAKQEVVRALIEPERTPGPAADPVAVLYLFCHYGTDTDGKSILRFGLNSADPNDVIREPELGTAAIASRPLVFANACATSGTGVYSASKIAKSFFDRGCRAYIGSECMVPVAMASRFAMIFFYFLLREVDPSRAPISAGEALTQARLFLWCHYRNVGGLLYSYLNQYDLYLASAQELAGLRKGWPP